MRRDRSVIFRLTDAEYAQLEATSPRVRRPQRERLHSGCGAGPDGGRDAPGTRGGPGGKRERSATAMPWRWTDRRWTTCNNTDSQFQEEYELQPIPSSMSRMFIRLVGGLRCYWNYHCRKTSYAVSPLFINRSWSGYRISVSFGQGIFAVADDAGTPARDRRLDRFPAIPKPMADTAVCNPSFATTPTLWR